MNIYSSVKIILRHRNKILLIKTFDGIIDIPGGKIEFGESNMVALKRELIEELELRINLKSVKLWHSWNYVTKNRDRHSVYIVYFLKLNKIPKIVKREVADVMWLTLPEIKKLRHIPEFKKMLIEALKS